MAAAAALREEEEEGQVASGALAFGSDSAILVPQNLRGEAARLLGGIVHGDAGVAAQEGKGGGRCGQARINGRVELPTAQARAGAAGAQEEGAQEEPGCG